MKKNLIILFFLLSLVYSCDDIFVDISGQAAKIQGKWQSTTADTLFFNFQNNLFEYQIYLEKDSLLSVYGFYTLLEDTAIYLTLLSEYAYINDRHLLNQYPLQDVIHWEMKKRGTEKEPDTLFRHFKMEGPSANKLKLIYESEELTFRKF